MIKRHMVPGQPKPYSHYCHVVRGGQHVWVSGACGMNPDGSINLDRLVEMRINRVGDGAYMTLEHQQDGGRRQPQRREDGHARQQQCHQPREDEEDGHT